eukprot:gene10744-biopygen10845
MRYHDPGDGYVLGLHRKCEWWLEWDCRDWDVEHEDACRGFLGGRRMITIKIELHDVEDARNTARILRVLAQESPSFYKAGLAEPACGKRWGTRLRESHGSGQYLGKNCKLVERRLGRLLVRIVAEGGFLISKEVRLRNEDITPVDYCPCCSRMLHLDRLDVGLAPSMVRTKTEHCLKRTWLWRGRERRGKYA